MLQLYDEFHGPTMQFCERGSDVFALMRIREEFDFRTLPSRSKWNALVFCLQQSSIDDRVSEETSVFKLHQLPIYPRRKSVRFQLLIGSAETIVKSPKS